MKKKLKSINFLIVLTALMFISVNSFAAADSQTEPDVNPKTSAATPLSLNTEKTFSFTNTTQFASYEVNFTANKVYQLQMTNDKGCNLRAYVHYPEYRKEYYYYNPDYTDIHGTDLNDIYGNEFFDMSVDAGEDWNSTKETTAYMVDKNMTVIVNIYGNGKNQSLAWEDLGGKVKVKDVTSALGSASPITDGWVSSFNKTDESNTFRYKYKKVNVSETGLYNFFLNSTGNSPEIELYRDNPYTPEVLPGSRLLTLENWNESTTEEADFDQIYLPEGIYYLRADSLGSYNLSSWDLKISKTTLPTVADGTTTVSVDNEVPSDQDGTITLKQGIMVQNITLGELFDVSVTCPEGYNITNPISYSYNRGENKTESGVIMLMENKVPTLYKQNGKDSINRFPMIYGVDQDTEDGENTERTYGTHYSQVTYDWNITEYGIDAMFWVSLQNVSVDVGDISFDFTFKSSSNQPETLNPGDKTFNFDHLSANDDEGIYKLNSSTSIGNVMDFKMKSMGDYAQADMSFISNLYNPMDGGDLGYIKERSLSKRDYPYIGDPIYKGFEYDSYYKRSFTWNNDTYDDHINGNYYDTLPTEVAVLSDTWVILQDAQDSGYPDKNTTTFTLNIANRSSISMNEKFNKQRGTDLILLDVELPPGSNIHIEELNGIIQNQEIQCTADYYYDGVEYDEEYGDGTFDIDLNNRLYLISKDGTMYDYKSLGDSTDKSITTGRTTSEYYLVLELPTTHGVRNETVNGDYDEDFTAVVLMEPEAPQANIGTFRVTATFFETEEETGGFEIPGYPFFITLSVSVFFVGLIAYISRKKRFNN